MQGVSDQYKVAVVTGASSGIGRATAKLLAQQGLKVLVLARRKQRLDELVCEIEAAGGTAMAREVDVTDAEQLKAVVASAHEQWGSIDVLINNAGVMLLSRLDAMRVEDWNTMVDVNVKGVMNGFAAVLPFMRSQKAGHVITVSSDADRKLFSGSFVYSATKAFVSMFCEGVKRELSEVEQLHAIKVTSMSSGAVATELSSHVPDERIFDEWKAGPPIHPMSADDVAATILMVLQAPKNVSVLNVLFRPNDQSS